MFPTSWYMIDISSSLAVGQTRTIQILGQELQVKRSPDGSVQVTDESGKELHVRDVNDMIMVWYGDEEPWFEVEAFPELSKPEWRPVRWHRSRVFRTTVDNTMRDAVDNGHFGPVHGLDRAETQAWQEGPYLDTRSQGIIDTKRMGGPSLKGHLYLKGRLYGMGLLTYRMTITLGIQLHNVTFSASTPVDAEHVQMFGGVSLRKVFLLSGLIQRQMVSALAKDYESDALHRENSGRYNVHQLTNEETVLFDLYDGWLSQFQAAA